MPKKETPIQSSWWMAIVVTIIPILFLGPFVARAFTVDDVLFVWSAHQIQTHPLDFFGFSALWGCREEPMTTINQNPPGAAYYAALIMSLAGESEISLHIGFLLAACAVSLGTWRLAHRFCTTPMAATVLSILSPVFLLTSTTIMCDTLMTAFYVWAVVLWLYGLDKGHYWPLLLSAILIACAALTKYFGATLIPLLGAYTLLRWRTQTTPRCSLFILLLPILTLAAFEYYCRRLYGIGLIQYAIHLGATLTPQPDWTDKSTPLAKTLIGITFLGGCFIGILFLAPLLWRFQTWGAVIILSATCLALLCAISPSCRTLALNSKTFPSWITLQWLLFLTTGLFTCLLAATDLWRTRDSDATLLFLWFTGTLTFTIFINWTINGRVLLPITPIIGILIIRHLEHRYIQTDQHIPWRHIGLSFAPAIFISLAATWGDYTWANTARTAVHTLAADFSTQPARTVWYQGQWGFQYYAATAGWKPMTIDVRTVEKDDLVVVPENNITCLDPFRPGLRPLTKYHFSANRWISVMNTTTGAGFYCHYWGPLPYIFGPVPPEKYTLYGIKFPET